MHTHLHHKAERPVIAMSVSWDSECESQGKRIHMHMHSHTVSDLIILRTCCQRAEERGQNSDSGKEEEAREEINEQIEKKQRKEERKFVCFKISNPLSLYLSLVSTEMHLSGRKTKATATAKNRYYQTAHKQTIPLIVPCKTSACSCSLRSVCFLFPSLRISNHPEPGRSLRRTRLWHGNHWIDKLPLRSGEHKRERGRGGLVACGSFARFPPPTQKKGGRG